MSLGLRGKYVVAFGGVLAILLVVAGGGLLWLSRLGGSIEVILRENYRSVVAAQQMKEALERMDSGALFALTGDPEEGRRLVREHAPEFQEALATELSNITLPNERERAEQIESRYAAFRQSLEEVLDTSRSVESRRRVYFDELLPTFLEVKQLADDVLRMNQENMVAASARARSLAARGRERMLLLSLAATLLAAGFAVYLGRSTLVPIRRLTRSAREIEQGHLELAVDVPRDDEIGELAKAFNAMAARLRELRRDDRARLVRAQRTSGLAINSLRDAVFLLSPDGTVELANPMASSLLDIRSEVSLPERHRLWVERLVRDAERESPGSARTYGEAMQFFVDGSERFYLPTAVRIRDDEGELVGVTVVLADVTDLRKLDEMRNDLLAAASHELMTPVTSLGMAVDLLESGRMGALTGRQRELLEGAAEDVNRLERIIEGVLDVSRLETGSPTLDLRPLDLVEFLEEVVGRSRPGFRNADVELELRVEDGVRVLADRERAALVLSNLLGNALKHSPAGGRVVVQAQRRGEPVHFVVADSGPGVPAGERERIFEKFHQLPGSSDGVGLGLAIAREIVVAHGGRIWCESVEGEGSEFHFELPAG